MLTSETTNKGAWYIDSCASSHMTFRSDWIRDAEQHNSKVTAAGDEKLASESQGKVILKVNAQGRQEKLTAEQVLYVPNLTANLLSVSKIVAKGNTVVFNKEGCSIRDEQGEVVARGSMKNGVYTLDTAKEQAYATVSTNNEDYNWHRHLRHLNRHAMSTLADGLAVGLAKYKVSEEPCEICVKGKQSR